MRKMCVLFISITLLFLSNSVLAQKITTLQPRSIELEKLKKAREAWRQANKDVKPVKRRLENSIKRRFTTIETEDECDQILTNRTMDDCPDLPIYGNVPDSIAVYFKAPEDTRLLSTAPKFAPSRVPRQMGKATPMSTKPCASLKPELINALIEKQVSEDAIAALKPIE